MRRTRVCAVAATAAVLTAIAVVTPGAAAGPAVTLTAPASGSRSNDNRPAFAGTATNEPGSLPAITVSVSLGSGAAGTPIATLTTDQSAGSWSVAFPHPLGDGTYTAVASQSDDAGNSATSAPSTFTIDSTPPPVTLATPANGSSTTDRLPAFSGTSGVQPGDSPSVVVDVYAGPVATGT